MIATDSYMYIPVDQSQVRPRKTTASATTNEIKCYSLSLSKRAGFAIDKSDATCDLAYYVGVFSTLNAHLFYMKYFAVIVS